MGLLMKMFLSHPWNRTFDFQQFLCLKWWNEILKYVFMFHKAKLSSRSVKYVRNIIYFLRKLPLGCFCHSLTLKNLTHILDTNYDQDKANTMKVCAHHVEYIYMYMYIYIYGGGGHTLPKTCLVVPLKYDNSDKIQYFLAPDFVLYWGLNKMNVV